jgi:GDP-L-fucose synthase
MRSSIRRGSALIPKGRYIVAGSAGLTGSHALERLANEASVEVTALYHHRPPSVSAANIFPRKCDLADAASANECLQGGDYLLLFAGRVAPAPVLARDPVAPAVENARIVVTALEAAWRHSIKKVVWLSSTTVYPDVETELTEDLATRGDPPGNWYAIGWTMRYLEALSRAYANHPTRPLVCVALRPTLIYGAHCRFDDDAHFVPAFVRRVADREDPVEVWGHGQQERDLVHADDVVEASLRALGRVDGFDAFNIGSGTSVTVNEVLTRLLRLDGYSGARIAHRPDKPSSSRSRRIVIERARSILGYSPQISLDEGLTRTLAWYRERPRS